jgi:hypothetical protein
MSMQELKSAVRRMNAQSFALVAVVLLGLGAGGCLHAKADRIRQNYVRDKAALQFDCPRTEIDVEPIDESVWEQDDSWSAEGCDKDGIYRLTDHGPDLQHSDQ